jgi:hypothetical protein
MRNRVARIVALAASAFTTLVVVVVTVGNIGLPLGMVASLWLLSMSFTIQRNVATRTTTVAHRP